MALVLAGVLFLASNVASAEYESIEHAVAAALAEIKSKEDGSKYEYVGIVYQDPETQRFRYTEPLSQGKRNKAGGSHAVPKGSARAVFHNHPENISGMRAHQRDELRKFFSQGDLELSAKTGLLSYIGAGDEIYQWNPKEPGTIIMGGGRGSAIRKRQELGEGTLIGSLQDFLPQDDG